MVTRIHAFGPNGELSPGAAAALAGLGGGGAGFVTDGDATRPETDRPVILLPGADSDLAENGDLRIVETVTPFVESSDVRAIVRLTQAEYDGLDPEPDVLYLVTE